MASSWCSSPCQIMIKIKDIIKTDSKSGDHNASHTSAIRTANPGKYLMPPGAGQGSRNIDILASGMGGNGDRKRNCEGKCYQQGLKIAFCIK